MMNWIERAFNVAPDSGSGATEWLIVVSLVMMVIAAYVGWRAAHRGMR